MFLKLHVLIKETNEIMLQPFNFSTIENFYKEEGDNYTKLFSVGSKGHYRVCETPEQIEARLAERGLI